MIRLENGLTQSGASLLFEPIGIDLHLDQSSPQSMTGLSDGFLGLTGGVFGNVSAPAQYWTEAGGLLYPTTVADRVLIGGATDDGVSYLQTLSARIYDNGAGVDITRPADYGGAITFQADPGYDLAFRFVPGTGNEGGVMEFYNDPAQNPANRVIFKMTAGNLGLPAGLAIGGDNSAQQISFIQNFAVTEIITTDGRFIVDPTSSLVDDTTSALQVSGVVSSDAVGGNLLLKDTSSGYATWTVASATLDVPSGNGIIFTNDAGDGGFRVGTAGETYFFGWQTALSYADRSNSDPSASGGFLMINGVQSIWSSLAYYYDGTGGIINVANNGDVAIGKVPYGSYSSDATTSNIPAGFYVDRPTSLFNGNVNTNGYYAFDSLSSGLYWNYLGIDASTEFMKGAVGHIGGGSFDGNGFAFTNATTGTKILGAVVNADTFFFGSVQDNLIYMTMGDTLIYHPPQGAIATNLGYFNYVYIGSDVDDSSGAVLQVTGGISNSVLSASGLVFTDASKVLTSTGIGTSSQFIKGDGSLDSTTYQPSGTYPKIVASNNATGQTATNSSVVTFTTPNDATHSYRVGAYTAITAISAGTLTVTVTFTDENNTSRTITYFPMGLTTAGLTSTGFTAFAPVNIRVKQNTAITLVATFTGVSTTYDVGGTIESLY